MCPLLPCLTLVHISPSSAEHKYIGEYVEGRRNGHGKIKYASGDLYEGLTPSHTHTSKQRQEQEGEEELGLFHRLFRGCIAYGHAGNFVNGVFHGHGKFQYSNGMQHGMTLSLSQCAVVAAAKLCEHNSRAPTSVPIPHTAIRRGRIRGGVGKRAVSRHGPVHVGFKWIHMGWQMGAWETSL